jgi:hypothetical protein
MDKQKKNKTLRRVENRDGSADRKFNPEGCATRPFYHLRPRFQLFHRIH